MSAGRRRLRTAARCGADPLLSSPFQGEGPDPRPARLFVPVALGRPVDFQERLPSLTPWVFAFLKIETGMQRLSSLAPRPTRRTVLAGATAGLLMPPGGTLPYAEYQE